MISNNESTCPKCGSDLKYYDSVKRLVRTKYGRNTKVNIRRFRCPKCGSIHRELPDFIFPYKQYEADIIEPIISAIVDEMKRKFLTKTARSQLQSISFFRDPFKLVPVNDIAEIADKFTRNEIMTSNEIRQVVGMKPSEDPRADELRNKNLSAPSESTSEIPSVSKETVDVPE